MAITAPLCLDSTLLPDTGVTGGWGLGDTLQTSITTTQASSHFLSTVAFRYCYLCTTFIFHPKPTFCWVTSMVGHCLIRSSSSWRGVCLNMLDLLGGCRVQGGGGALVSGVNYRPLVSRSCPGRSLYLIEHKYRGSEHLYCQQPACRGHWTLVELSTKHFTIFGGDPY